MLRSQKGTIILTAIHMAASRVSIVGTTIKTIMAWARILRIVTQDPPVFFRVVRMSKTEGLPLFSISLSQTPGALGHRYLMNTCGVPFPKL